MRLAIRVDFGAEYERMPESGTIDGFGGGRIDLANG